MAPLIPSSDRTAIKAQVLAIARELLRELGDESPVEGPLGSANLERDLRLGSIERVELLSRLEKGLRVSLPEEVVTEAKTLDDIVATITAASASAGDRQTEQIPAAVGNSETAESQDVWSESKTRHPDNAAYNQLPLFRCAWEMIYGIFAAAVFLVWLPLTWLIVLLMPRGRPAARMTSASLRLYFALIGCRLHIEGEEHVHANGACIYVSNHTSYSDVPVIMALFRTDYHFLAKSEINDMPFVGTFLRRLGHFSFERGKLRARSRQAEQMEQALRRGESIFVFAEGTFVAGRGVRPFQLGAFRAAVRTGRPIVPIAIRGARRFHRDGTFLPKPARIEVIVSPALFSSAGSFGREWTEVLRLRDETRRIISIHSGEGLLQPDKTEPAGTPPGVPANSL